jgi:hypothetical protein
MTNTLRVVLLVYAAATLVLSLFVVPNTQLRYYSNGETYVHLSMGPIWQAWSDNSKPHAGMLAIEFLTLTAATAFVGLVLWRRKSTG